MKRYKEALADLENAIALDRNDSFAFVTRGEIYQIMERYEEALADFDQALALDKDNDWNWYEKSVIYLLRGENNLFHHTLHIALDIARSRIERLTKQDEDYYLLRFNTAFYLLVNDSIGEAEADYRELLSMCSIVSRLQDAATDLEKFLSIQPTSEFAKNVLIMVNKHIEELIIVHL